MALVSCIEEALVAALAAEASVDSAAVVVALAAAALRGAGEMKESTEQISCPHWVKHFLQPVEVDEIRAAVANAEKRTSGEIVPMVVRKSSTIDHVFLVVTLTLALAFWMLHLPLQLSPYTGEFLAGAIFLILATSLGALLARIPGLQRLCVSRQDSEQQVRQRAELEFFEYGLGRTRDATGVLLFISLMEHKAVVFADESISEKMPPETWQEVVDQMIAGIKKKDAKGGLISAIHKCADILSPHFPRPEDDTNELRDHLIIKE